MMVTNIQRRMGKTDMFKKSLIKRIDIKFLSGKNVFGTTLSFIVRCKTLGRFVSSFG